MSIVKHSANSNASSTLVEKELEKWSETLVFQTIFTTLVRFCHVSTNSYFISNNHPDLNEMVLKLIPSIKHIAMSPLNDSHKP